jgi:protein-disulfide isomerase
MANRHKKKKDLQGLVFATVLIVLLGVGIFAIFDQFLSTSHDAAVPEKVSGQAGGEKPLSDVYAGQPTLGNKNAPVKVLEFADFKCPYCKMFHDQVFPKLKKEWIDTGKVQFVFANFQFIGPDSVTAGMAGESIYKQYPDAFWNFYDAIYTYQGSESKVWATPEFLVDLVKKHVPGVDANKLAQELKAKTWEKEVLKDNKLAREHGIKGVPAVFVNGKKVENPLDYNVLKQAIEEAMKQK